MTPSQAQINAAREAWPRELPLPSDAELEVLVQAVIEAPWPDGVRPAGEPQ